MVFSMVTCAGAVVVCTGGGGVVVVVVGSGRRSSATVETDMVRVLLYWRLMVV
jgi:carbamate kinase